MPKNLLIIGNNWVYKVKNKFYGYPQWYFFDYFSKYFKVSLIAPVKKSDSPKGLLLKNIKIVPLPFFHGNLDLFKKFYFLPYIFYIYLINIPKSHIIFVFTSDVAATLGLLISKVFKKPLVFFIGEDWEKDIIEKYPNKIKKFIFILISRFLRRIQFAVLDKKDLLLVNHESLISKHKNIRCRIYLYYLSLISKKEIFIKKPRKIKKGDKVKLLYVGFLIRVKGLQNLINALSILKQAKFPYEIELDIIGEGSFRRELEEMIANQNIKNVNFHGFIGNKKTLKELYLQSDIFVLPSLTEGVPKVLFEAMAFGVPIIATKVGGIPDINANKFVALLVSPNPLSIAKAISRLVTNYKLRQEMVKNGYEFVKDYTIERAADHIYNILRKNFKFL